MHVLFEHAKRYDWTDRNPISMVRQSARRLRVPDVLEPTEIKALLAELEERYKTMVFLDVVTGLRVSELLALQWRDINFVQQEISLSRAIVHRVVGEMKTEASRRPVAIDAESTRALSMLRERSPFNQLHDWVFASPHRGARQPYWDDSILKRRIRPAALRAGLTKRIGWHTFRHTFATLLKGNREDAKVVQDSMRHANSRTTLDLYAQSLTAARRDAQNRVVQVIRPSTEPLETEGIAGEQHNCSLAVFGGACI
jgi:integrase